MPADALAGGPVPTRPRGGGRARGHTLVDVLVAGSVAVVLATLALPAWNAQLHRARRSDAVAALTRLQAAQERLFASQGRYGGDLQTLQLAPRSAEGLYALTIESTGPDSYRASATALAGAAQAGDRDCPQLALLVNGGFAQIGPSARCWNR